MNKPGIAWTAVLFLIVSPARGEPNPKPATTPHVSPRTKKESTVRTTPRPPESYLGFGTFLLELNTDGSVIDVLVLRSTGNKAFDAWMARGLLHNRFKPDQLSEEQWAEKRAAVRIPFTMETFKASKHIPNPRVLVEGQIGPRRYKVRLPQSKSGN